VARSWVIVVQNSVLSYGDGQVSRLPGHHSSAELAEQGGIPLSGKSTRGEMDLTVCRLSKAERTLSWEAAGLVQDDRPNKRYRENQATTKRCLGIDHVDCPRCEDLSFCDRKRRGM